MAVRDIVVGNQVVWGYQEKEEEWSGCKLVQGTATGQANTGSGRCTSLSQSLVFTISHKSAMPEYADCFK